MEMIMLVLENTNFSLQYAYKYNPDTIVISIYHNIKANEKNSNSRSHILIMKHQTRMQTIAFLLPKKKKLTSTNLSKPITTA